MYVSTYATVNWMLLLLTKITTENKETGPCIIRDTTVWLSV